MKRVLILAFGLMLLGAGASAQERVVRMLPGERWWGAATDLGVSMPFDSSTMSRSTASRGLPGNSICCRA
ncbi:MAG: hypothetical protein K6G79_05395 [Bacteroidales bacterium]|nr:hypothetical protein [Bacteroidales bacterium]